MTSLWRGTSVAFARISAGLLISMAYAGPASAGAFDFLEGTEASYKLTFNYGAAMRVKSPAQELINGPVDPLQRVNPDPTNPNDPYPKFTHSGLPVTINFDDGDRNFKKGSLIHDRVSAYGEFQITHQNFGAVFSGAAFYDEVYHRKNNNDSVEWDQSTAATANVKGPTNVWTPGARRYDGQRARLLDAYMFADWQLSDTMALDLRFGQQLVAWGESLFLSGIALAQAPADATKAFVPGAEVKEILLPVNQVAMQLSLSDRLTFLSYYHLAFKATELFPVGDYLNPADLVGPGATFGYGSINPAYGEGCPGLLNFTTIGDASFLCNQPSVSPALATGLQAKPFIYVDRLNDLEPSKHGQYGVGLKYQLTSITNVGAYFLRYSSTTPAVQLNMGYGLIGYDPSGAPITTSIIKEVVPVSYNVRYYDGIHLYGLSYSTVLGPFNVAGEFLYRQNIDTSVQAKIADVLSPISTRGNISQALLSGLYVANPKIFFDEFVFVGEAGVVHLNKATPIVAEDGLVPVGNGDVPFYDKTSYGFQTLLIPKKRNAFEGWDIYFPTSYGMLVKGNPSMAGAFGSLYGEGDKRLSLGFGAQYLQNLEFGLSYNFFFGNPNKTIGNSTLKANPYSDRDYVTFNVKYNI